MLSANSIATPPHLAMSSHYATQHRAVALQAYDARASGSTAEPQFDHPGFYSLPSPADTTAATTSAFAIAALPASTATIAAAALAAANAAPGSNGQIQTMASAADFGGYGDGRGGWANNSSGTSNNTFVDSRHSGGSLLVAPRPVQAQQMGLPPWMLTALPLDVLVSLNTPSNQHKIINDVFFTPEERPQSPQLTPVSDTDDARLRLLAPSDGFEGLDSSVDLALFAAESRSVWGSDEIETTSVCSSNTRHASPTPTITSFDDSDDDFSVKCLHSSPLSVHVAAQAKSAAYACGGSSETASLSGDSCVDETAVEHGMARESLRPTVFEELSHNGVDWCRYCGTTEGINWRPGPWGKRTLCNKHGCDYKGYGFASKMPRLNLKNFVDEALDERIRPVLQTFCQMCQLDTSELDNVLVHCDGCHRAYHQCCHPEGICDSEVSLSGSSRWYCEPSCRDNARKRRIVVELPKCRLPYMCSPRHTAAASQSANGAALIQSMSISDSPSRRSFNKIVAPVPFASVLKPIPKTRKRKTSDSSLSFSSPSPSPSPLPVPAMSQIESSKARLSAAAAAAKVRKSSRIARPSVKRLESDYAV
ncbi:hypothetical protein IWW39_000688 [Coemansia spiralis]|uniref:Zinc finger PHD-type domain-containing protein n=1 Tax=Coemansia spiralis TaxID=417178 RepID=A0A9W8GM01_9FUNG|nr:hypothetical protein IWW39_000688 [Coemansia spiralis]